MPMTWRSSLMVLQPPGARAGEETDPPTLRQQAQWRGPQGQHGTELQTSGLRWSELRPPVQKGHRDHQLSTHPPTHAVLNLAPPPTQKHRSHYSGSQRRKEAQRGSAALPGAVKTQNLHQSSGPNHCPHPAPTLGPGLPAQWPHSPRCLSCPSALVTRAEVIPDQRSLSRFQFPLL